MIRYSIRGIQDNACTSEVLYDVSNILTAMSIAEAMMERGWKGVQIASYYNPNFRLSLNN